LLHGFGKAFTRNALHGGWFSIFMEITSHTSTMPFF
jgi:hypothetical protein